MLDGKSHEANKDKIQKFISLKDLEQNVVQTYSLLVANKINYGTHLYFNVLSFLS